jgi:hypothetical protein
MTVDEYYAAVRRLGLRPSAVPNIFLTSATEVFSVPDPTHRTQEEREEIIEKLKGLLGINPRVN